MAASAHSERSVLLKSSRQRVWVHLTFAVLACLWTFHAGLDVNFDLLNYHLYAGYSVFDDRFSKDFFAAFPAYYNPYAFAPFYLLWRVGLPAIAIAGFLTLLQWVMIVLTYELAFVVDDGGRRRALVAATAAGFAFLNPVFLVELGTSFNDITTGIPVLAAWWVLAIAWRHDRPGLVMLGGALMGAATALKLSNAIFAVATVFAYLGAPVFRTRKLSPSLRFVAGGVIAFIAIAGPWSLRLWHEFGNPFFPMFNGWFRSPEFGVEGATLDRFLPQSWTDWLSLPLRMLLPLPMVHIETAAPDLRYLALIVVAALAVARAWRLRRKASLHSIPGEQWMSGPMVSTLGVVFVVAWVLWQLTSGNSRYFIPGSCLASVMLALLLRRVVGSRAGVFLAVSIGLLSVQTTQFALGATPRYAAAPWAEDWIGVRIPSRYVIEPHFFMVLDTVSLSFLAPMVHPESGFFNASGGFTFDPEGPGSARARRLMAAHPGRLRLLTVLNTKTSQGRFRRPSLQGLDQRLLPWGLRIEASDCESIGMDYELFAFTIDEPSPASPTEDGQILSCRLTTADESDRQRQAIARAEIAPVFEHLETACPQLFRPKGLFIEGGRGNWRKSYGASDTSLMVKGGRVSYRNEMQGGDPIDVGTVADWLAAPRPIACSLSRRDRLLP